MKISNSPGTMFFVTPLISGIMKLRQLTE